MMCKCSVKDVLDETLTTNQLTLLHLVVNILIYETIDFY